MDVLYDLRDTVRDNLVSVLAAVFIAVTMIWFAVFVSGTLWPHWTARQELATQVLAAQQALHTQQGALQDSAAALEVQLANLQAQLGGTTTQFLTEAQAAAVLDSLYRYAALSSVTITGLKAQAADTAVPAADSPAPTPATTISTPYNVQAFDLQAEGPVTQLLALLGRMEETTWPGVTLEGVTIVENPEGQGVLTMKLSLYTSPLAVPPTPPAAPFDNATTAEENIPALPAAPVAEQVTALLNSLYEPWTAENWPEAIRILNQILQLDPTNDDMQTRLYAAHVYYAYELTEAQRLDEARAAYTQALAVKPDGVEAQAGLNNLSTP